MRIIFNCIGTKPLFYSKGGAIQKLVGYQIENLKEDHQLMVVGQMARKIKGIELIEEKNFFDLSWLNFFIGGFKGFWQMKSLEADLIIATHPRNFLASFLYSKLKKIPFLAWEMDHDIWVEPETKVKKIYHWLIKQVDEIITLSQIQKERMVKKGINSKKIKVIPAAIDTKKFTPAREEKKNYLLSVGKFIENKNQLTLLQAFKELIEQDKFKELKLYLVGPSSGAFTSPERKSSDYYQHCQQYVKKENLKEKVKFYQWLEEKELIKLYQQATLFVFPSQEEGFGLVLLEAMACGCPCLVNKIEPLTEVSGETGKIVDACQPEILAREINKILTNKELVEKMSRQARKRAVAVFGLKTVNQQFRDLIENYQ